MKSSAVPQKPSSQLASSKVSLKPRLGNALDSLNVQLEHELARYRYARKTGTHPVAKPPYPTPTRSLSFATTSTQSQSAQSSHRAVAPPPLPPNPRLQDAVGSQSAQPQTAQTSAVSASQTANQANAVNAAPQPAASSASEVAALRSVLVHQASSPQAESEPESGAYRSSSEALLASFSSDTYRGQVPETVTQQPDSSWVKYLNTPLGIGALMLLLVTSAGFGFVLVNPLAVQHLVSQTPLARIWPASAIADDDAIADATAATTSATTDPATADDRAALNPLGPDLSQREFTDLNFSRLSTLPTQNIPGGAAANAAQSGLAPNNPSNQSTLPPLGRTQVSQPSPNAPGVSAPAASSAPTSTTNTDIPTTTGMPPIATPPATPSVQPSAPEPAAAPATAPAPIASPVVEPSALAPEPPSEPAPFVPANDAANPPTVVTESGVNDAAVGYDVVTDFTGDPSLDTAREVVEDAWLRNSDSGAHIQLGSFDSEEAANEWVEELQNQGIEAEVK